MPATRGRPGSAHDRLVEVERYAQIVGGLTPHHTMIDLARVSLRHLVAEQDGNLSATGEVVVVMEELRRAHGPGSPLHSRTELLAAAMRAYQAASRGDLRGVAAGLQQILEAAELIPPGDPVRMQIDQMRDTVGALFQIFPSGGFAESSSGAPEGRVLVQRWTPRSAS